MNIETVDGVIAAVWSKLPWLRYCDREDLRQDLYLAAARAYSLGDVGDARFRSYLYTAVHNAAIRHFYTNRLVRVAAPAKGEHPKRKAARDRVMAISTLTTDVAREESEDHGLIDLLEKLPQEQREAIETMFDEKPKRAVRHLAERLNVSKSTIYSRRRLGLLALRRMV